MAAVVVPIQALDRTKKGVGSATKRFGALRGTLGGVGKAGKIAAIGIGAIAVVGIGVGIKLAKDFLVAGDALHKMNLRTGISVEELQKMRFAAEQSGSSLEVFEKGLQTFNKGLADAATKGTGPVADGLELVGLGLKDLQGLAPEEQFKVMADAIAAIEDPTLAAAASQKLFGGAGRDLLPLLKEGADGINKLGAQAEAAGNIMSSETAAAAAKFNDEMNLLKQQLGSLAQRGFQKLIPYMLDFLGVTREHIIPAIKLAAQWIREEMVPAIGLMVQWIKGNWIPSVKQMVQWLRDEVPPAIRATVRWIKEEMIPAIQATVRWIKENGPRLIVMALWLKEKLVAPSSSRWCSGLRHEVIPVLQDLAKWFKDDVVPALKLAVQWLRDEVPPAIRATVRWIKEEMIPAIQATVRWIKENLVPVLVVMALWLKEKLVAAVKLLVQWIKAEVIPVLQDLAKWFKDGRRPRPQAGGDVDKGRADPRPQGYRPVD